MKPILQYLRAQAPRLAAVRASALALVPDLLLVSGAALLAYGAGQVYRPAGFITAGLLLLVAGVLASRSPD
jgi:hypothetical protein